MDAHAKDGTYIWGSSVTLGWAKGESARGDGPAALSHSRGGLVTEPPTADAKTLFVGSIPLLASDEQLRALLGPGVECVHRPQKSFAFVEFDTAERAQQVQYS